MRKIAIVTASDTPYLPLLEGMLASIGGGGGLAQFDLGILDLGLTDGDKDRIRTHKANANFVKAEWRRIFPGIDKAPEYKKVFVSKPFIPDLFPGYDGYVWVDADIWFQDARAIDDYVEAGEKTGAAFSFESHPSYRQPRKVRKLEVFGKTFIRGVKLPLLNMVRAMFGSKVAAEVGIPPGLNSGLFYMAAGAPVWQAWQETLRAADLRRQHRRAQICDQTCLQVALIQCKLPYAIMPATHNWLPVRSPPLIDGETFALLDPAWPHPPIKAVHLITGSHAREFDLPVTDGRRIRTRLGWTEFQRLRAENACKAREVREE